MSPQVGVMSAIEPDVWSALQLTALSDVHPVSQSQAMDLPSLSDGHQLSVEKSDTMDTPKVPALSLQPGAPVMAGESDTRRENEVGSSTGVEEPYRKSAEQEEWLERYCPDAVSALLVRPELSIEVYPLLSEILTYNVSHLLPHFCFNPIILVFLHCYLVQ